MGLRLSSNSFRENEQKGKYFNTEINRNIPDNVINKTKVTKEKSAGISRSPSGADVTEQYLTQLAPIEKLAENLKQKSLKYNGTDGIVMDVFVSHVFPQYTDLGQRLFNFLHSISRATTSHLGIVAFRQQCERFLGIMDDAKILECYIKMYAQGDFIDKEGVTRLLLICYTIALQHSGNIVFCPAINKTFTSITNSIFFNHDSLSIGFVCRWFEQNLIRLVLLIHKYCVHMLSTAYRGLENLEHYTCGIELQTPVIEKQFLLSNCDTVSDRTESTLMSLSQAWLLAGALSPLYSKPQALHSSATKNSSSVHVFRDKLSMMPSHWTLLYNSIKHGFGANRFLHHTLAYRGPTLVLLQTKDSQIYCIAAPKEWKETHLFTGGEGSCVLQLFPKFDILERKPNILYLNASIRGYPKGLRAGADPRKPLIAIDENFEKINCKGIAEELLSIEVWGCGDEKSREVQLDIKKWQVREAERQRTVKLTAADWMDHPDRYLLELSGRPNYNN